MELIMGAVSGAITVMGFIAIWIKVGRSQGRLEEMMKSIVKQTEKHEVEIAGLRDSVHKIQLDIVKLDYIKDAVALLNRRRRA
jgi:uncharacterized protein YoxC